MKKLAASIILSLALAIPSAVSAQPMIYPDQGLYTDTNYNRTNMMTDTNQKFDWKWLLPLVLLPLLYLAFKKGDEYDREYQAKFDIPMSGVRGGEATSNGYEDERLGWHDDEKDPKEKEFVIKKLTKIP